MQRGYRSYSQGSLDESTAPRLNIWLLNLDHSESDVVVVADSWRHIFKNAASQTHRLRILLIICLGFIRCTEINKWMGRKEQLYFVIPALQEVIISKGLLHLPVSNNNLKWNFGTWNWLRNSNWSQSWYWRRFCHNKFVHATIFLLFWSVAVSFLSEVYQS